MAGGGRRDLWLPVLVLALGWAASLITWWLLVANRREATLGATRELAVDVGDRVARGVEVHLRALDRLGDLWALTGRDADERWRADLDQLMRSLFPALGQVVWIDPHGGVHPLRPGARPAGPPPLLEPGARATSGPTLRGPELDAGGDHLLRVLLPVGEPDGAAGRLASAVDVEELLDGILGGRSRGYALRIRWEDQEVFVRGEPSADPRQGWWHAEAKVELPGGVAWDVTLRPTPELASRVLTPIPHYLLASGLALSLLLAALAHQLRLTLRQSRFLAATNRALEERGGELERRVAERTRELEEAVAELRAFNQSISHDLRSPLGAVLNFSTILEEDYRDRPLDEEGLAILARIRRSAVRATELLEGLRKLSRAGRDALEIVPVDMTSLAKEIFTQVRVAEDDDVEFVAGELPEVPGDRTLLGDVFSNLFTNALRYSRGCEKRKISVRGSVDGDTCVFEVADNGRGFDMRFKEKLFGMFERLDPDDDVDGTGAGLAIVARIVRRHGGRVWAEGRPGEGASFFFSLPRIQEIRS